MDNTLDYIKCVLDSDILSDDAKLVSLNILMLQNSVNKEETFKLLLYFLQHNHKVVDDQHNMKFVQLVKEFIIRDLKEEPDKQEIELLLEQYQGRNTQLGSYLQLHPDLANINDIVDKILTKSQFTYTNEELESLISLLSSRIKFHISSNNDLIKYMQLSHFAQSKGCKV